MDNKTYPINTFDGITVKVTSATQAGRKLKGMSSDKVFIKKDGLYYFNRDDQLYQVKEMTATDQQNNIININTIAFDTENRVAGIIKKNNQTLLIHRVKNGKEYYVFPGGHNKRGESFEETLIREMEEETGIKIKSAQLFETLAQEGFATEYFFITEDIDTTKTKSTNPDCKEGEISEPIWMDNVTCASMDNILPEVIAVKLFNTQPK